MTDEPTPATGHVVPGEPTLPTPVAPGTPEPGPAAQTVTPVEQSSQSHGVHLGRGLAVLIGVLLVVAGLGAGVAIGAGVWAGDNGANPTSVNGFGGRFVRPGGGPLGAMGGGGFGPGGFGNRPVPGFNKFPNPPGQSNTPSAPTVPGSPSAGGTTGKVAAITGTTIIVETQDGRSVTVSVPASASITPQPKTFSDVSTGSCVEVTGTAGSGTAAITATTLQILPNGSAGCS
jgi:hypothetical protein